MMWDSMGDNLQMTTMMLGAPRLALLGPSFLGILQAAPFACEACVGINLGNMYHTLGFYLISQAAQENWYSLIRNLNPIFILHKIVLKLAVGLPIHQHGDVSLRLTAPIYHTTASKLLTPDFKEAG